MHCPYCSHIDTQVLETRLIGIYNLRRRRRCQQCDKRFTTYEKIEQQLPMVKKRDQTRVPFDSTKLMRSFFLALNKRPIPSDVVAVAVKEIEEKAIAMGEVEIDTLKLGQWTMEALEKIDAVGFVRYVSVYKSFNDVSEFITLISKK